MFCDRCGTENKETASFCRKCGHTLEATEVETRVAVRSPANISSSPTTGTPTLLTPAGPDDEAIVFAITPTLLFVKGGYALAAAAALLIVALIAGLTNISVLIAIVIGLLLFLVPAYFHIRQKLIRYTLTDTKLEVASGLVASTTRNVPLRRIQDVTVSATALQRLVGLGDIVIDNASEEGGKVVLKDIDAPRRYSDLLLKQMAKLDR